MADFSYDVLLDVGDTGITTIAATAAEIFTNPASQTSHIRMIHIHNANTTPETVKLYHVPDDAAAVGVAGVTNEIFNQIIDAGGDAFIEYAVPGRMLKDENDSIQATTTTASKVTITITGGKK